MSSSPKSLPATSDAATDAARTHDHFEPPVAQTPEVSRSQAQQLPAMCSFPTSLPATSDAGTDAARTHDHFEPEPPVAQTPEASRSQAQQDNAGVDALATEVKPSGIVDSVTPRRRGNEPKLMLTRELLESHYHEPLDTVTERLGLSKTTIKAACRRLGLEKWPYTHKGARKPRQRPGVPRPDQAGESDARSLKATFHELMANTGALPYAENAFPKRQRVGEEHMAPTVTLGVPFPPPQHQSATGVLPYLLPMQMQSVSALSAMVTALNSANQQLALYQQPPGAPLPPTSSSAPGQAQAFSTPGQTGQMGQAFAGQPPTSWMPVNPKPLPQT